jgi:hypothetical protein
MSPRNPLSSPVIVFRFLLCFASYPHPSRGRFECTSKGLIGYSRTRPPTGTRISLRISSRYPAISADDNGRSRSAGARQPKTSSPFWSAAMESPLSTSTECVNRLEGVILNWRPLPTSRSARIQSGDSHLRRRKLLATAGKPSPHSKTAIP